MNIMPSFLLIIDLLRLSIYSRCMRSVVAVYWSKIILLFGYSWIEIYNSYSIYLHLIDARV
jgi:hypothetical protein